MTPILLWDVDTQVDFLDPGGRLYVPGAERILPNLRQLTAWAGQHHISVIASACAHEPGDPELQIYGEHCMVGTPGQQKVAESLLPNRFVVSNRPAQLPSLKAFQQVIIEKQAFDFATNPNSREIIRQFEGVPVIALYGVVTEICVAAAARSLFAAGHKLWLVRDAIAELDAPKAESFITEFTSRGGTLITTNQVIASPTAVVA